MNTHCLLIFFILLCSYACIASHRKKHISKELRIFYEIFFPKDISKPHVSKYARLIGGGRGIKGCPMTFLKPYDDCVDIGCIPGDPCREPGMEQYKCCSHIFRGKLISCCKGEFVCPEVSTEKPTETTEAVKTTEQPIETTTMELSSTTEEGEGFECTRELITTPFNCMEMGCDIGDWCRSRDLENETCCPYYLKDGINVTCCKSNPQYVLDLSVDKKLITNKNPQRILTADRKKKKKKGCPAVPFPIQFHCMQISCKVGTPCTTRGLENRNCCPHTFNNQKITCCLAMPLYRRVPKVKFDCPVKKKPKKYDCFSMGCELGSTCPDGIQQCCQYVTEDIIARCCLRPAADRFTEYQVLDKPLTDDTYVCHLMKGVEYNCLAIGCELGSSCDQVGLDEKRCCVYNFGDNVARCCLLKLQLIPEKVPRMNDEDGVVVSDTDSDLCPEYKDDENYDCLAVGCKEGEMCEAEGFPESMCCSYEDESTSVTCCLVKHKETKKLAMKLHSYCVSFEENTEYDCISMGCVAGSPCTHEGQLDQQCCPYTFNTSIMTCCMKKRPSDRSNEPINVRSIPRCPPIESGKSYDCLKIGCTTGEDCVDVGLTDRDCCIYTKGELSATCCIRRHGISAIAVRKRLWRKKEKEKCPPAEDIPQFHECMEIGCPKFKPCTASGVEGKFCCPVIFGGSEVNCCLLLVRHQSHYYSIPPAGATVQRKMSVIPAGYNCVEMGCTPGKRCRSEGLQNDICYKRKVNKVTVTCCISLPRPVECKHIKLRNQESGLLDHFDCMDIGCDEGTPCNVDGSLERVCCPFDVNGKTLSCCLRRHFEDEESGEKK